MKNPPLCDNTILRGQAFEMDNPVMKTSPCIGVTLLFLVEAAAFGAELPRTAVFPLDFVDTSLEGQMGALRNDERQRLVLLDKQLREALSDSGCCSLIDTQRLARSAEAMHVRSCNDCAIDLARQAGAIISVTGWVQKVSNLILNINLVVQNISTIATIEAGSVDIRGNTDLSWSRGLAYLLRNRMHPTDWTRSGLLNERR